MRFCNELYVSEATGNIPLVERKEEQSVETHVGLGRRWLPYEITAIPGKRTPKKEKMICMIVGKEAKDKEKQR